MKKKYVWSVLLIVFMLTVLAACGGNDGANKGVSESSNESNEISEQTATSAPEDPTKLSGEITWMVFETPSYTTEFYKKVIANFNEKYPNIKVNTELFATGDRKAQINALYAAGQLPDLMLDGVDTLAAVEGALLSLPADLTEQFAQQGLVKFNDNIQYVPTSTQIKMGVYYNKDTFDKYGLAEPGNWEEFTAIMQTLKENGEIPIVTGGPDKPWLTGSLPSSVVDLQLSGAYGDTTGINKALFDGNLKFTDDAYATPIKNWAELIKNGYYHPGTMSFSMAQMNDTFMQGGATMLVNGIWFAPVLDAAKPAFDVGWFPIPTKNGNETYIVTYNGAMGISGKTKNPEQTLAFLKFFYEDEATYSMYLKADGVGGVLNNNPTYDAGPYTNLVYSKVEGLKAMTGNITDSKYILPKGVSTAELYQNIFAGADVDKELEKVQKAYDDALKMEGRK